MNNNYDIIKAEYIASAVKRDQYPAADLPEIAFIGRSNVGKSSLINSLARYRGLARVSGTPGKTQTINFYKLTLKDPEENRRDFHLVDLPGYGYAKRGKSMKREWSKFTEEYLLDPRLRLICQLIDIRHSPMPSDMAMFEWLAVNRVPTLLIATKADKISRGQIKRQVELIKKELKAINVGIVPYSALSGNGRAELLDVIANVLLQ